MQFRRSVNHAAGLWSRSTSRDCAPPARARGHCCGCAPTPGTSRSSTATRSWPHVSTHSCCGRPATRATSRDSSDATDALYARFYTVNAYFGAALSSAVGVLLADSRVLRGGRLAIRVLHDDAPSGGCGFVRGVNPAAMVALGGGFVVFLRLLEPVRQTPAAGFRTLSASRPVIAVALAIHLLCSRLFTIPRGLGAYPACGASTGAQGSPSRREA